MKTFFFFFFFGDGPLLFIAEMSVSGGEVYARPHGYVVCADSIRDQNQHSVVVFEDGWKNCVYEIRQGKNSISGMAL